MHVYVAENQERRLLYVLLAALAVVSGWVLHQLLSLLPVKIPWWIETPSVFGFFALYWKGFDLYAWRWNLSRVAGWSKVPDLNGPWQATVETRFNGQRQVTKGQGNIAQTASHHCVKTAQ